MDIANEPVRGGYPPQEWWALPGLERVRALVEDLVPQPPFNHLFGIRATHAAPGSATVTMPASPWFSVGPGMLSVVQLAGRGSAYAAHTVAGPGVSLAHQTSAHDIVRTPTVAMGRFVGKSRVVTAGGTRITTETTVEDASGRLVMRSSGQFSQVPMESAPRPRPLPPYTPASYDTPDPPNRPPPAEARRHTVEEALDLIESGAEFYGQPIARLLGLRFASGHDPLTTTAHLPLREWFGIETRTVGHIIPVVLFMACVWESAARLPMERVPVPNAFTIATTGAMPPRPDGREGIARASARSVSDHIVITDGVYEDADGTEVVLARLVSTVVDMPEASPAPEPDRVLLTVLFVDTVDSTGTAERLGDAKWRVLLEELGSLSRDAVTSNRGREVKNTGDGFLATFDSPARAIGCAQVVREAFEARGLRIRAGVHLGEIELVGADVAGIGVHVAARVESAAADGEIWVTSTVRQAMAGSGVAFEPRGTHELKGVSDTWELFEVL